MKFWKVGLIVYSHVGISMKYNIFEMQSMHERVLLKLTPQSKVKTMANITKKIYKKSRI